MPRPPEPEAVKQWRIKEPPQCCHTCDHYSKDGKCASFDMVPPTEFTSIIGQCDHWEEELPF